MTIITASFLLRLAPRAKAEIIAALVAPLGSYLSRYGITTPLRVAHFIAQACEETDEFRSLEEYASGKAYEGRKDLGNIQPGDGVRYKGRGIFQLTGRSNYAYYGKLLGLDLEGNPELAAKPEVSVQIACTYWDRKGLNAWADKDDVKAITYRLNGGYNNLATRVLYLERAKKLLNVSNDVSVPPTEDPKPEAPVVTISPKDTPIWQRLDVGSLASSAVLAVGSSLSGITGPLAWALGAAVFVGVIYGIYSFERYRREGH